MDAEGRDEEVRVDFAFIDFVIRDKQTGEKFAVEPGHIWYHEARHPQNQRRDHPDSTSSNVEIPVIDVQPPKEEVKKRTSKSKYKVSMGGLRLAIKNKDSKAVDQLVHKLFSRHAFKNDQQKADLLTYAIEQDRLCGAPERMAIIEKLVDLFGHRIITTNNQTGKSPLTCAIELGNESAVTLFIQKIIPEKFKHKSLQSYALWQQALQLAKEKNKPTIVSCLEAVGVVLPAETTLLTTTPLPTTPLINRQIWNSLFLG